MSRPLRQLPPYSGPSGPCPKCSQSGPGTHYHLGMAYPSENPRGEKWMCCVLTMFAQEHLCRLCGNCGYQWVEATADQKADLRAVPDA